jgi:hypothetical protein
MAGLSVKSVLRLFLYAFVLLALLGFARAQDDDDDEDDEYVESGDDGASAAEAVREPVQQQQQQEPPAQLELNEEWANTELTTALWRIISTHDTKGLRNLLKQSPAVCKVRAEDGRGPLFWAWEYGHRAGIRLLTEGGAVTDAKDSNGSTPAELAAADFDPSLPEPEEEEEEEEDGDDEDGDDEDDDDDDDDDDDEEGEKE